MISCSNGTTSGMRPNAFFVDLEASPLAAFSMRLPQVVENRQRNLLSTDPPPPHYTTLCSGWLGLTCWGFRERNGSPTANSPATVLIPKFGLFLTPHPSFDFACSPWHPTPSRNYSNLLPKQHGTHTSFTLCTEFFISLQSVILVHWKYCFKIYLKNHVEYVRSFQLRSWVKTQKKKKSVVWVVPTMSCSTTATHFSESVGLFLKL